MKKSLVNFDGDRFGKAVEAYVRDRAIRKGSFMVYEEDTEIVKEDPRTGKKTVLSAWEK